MTRQDWPRGARLLVVLNPRAGGGRGERALSQAEPVLRAAGCTLQVLVTQRAGQARELLATAPAALLPGGCDGVVVVGGDGTIHEVVNGLMDHAAAGHGGGRAGSPTASGLPPVGLVPAGSGNSLGADLGLRDAADAARLIVSGATCALDLLEVTLGSGEQARRLHAFNIVGWGLAADAGATAERLRWLGPRRYAVANVLQLLRRRVRPARLRLVAGGGPAATAGEPAGERSGERFDERLDGEMVMVLACNTRHTGAGMPIAPRARLGDGLLDLLVVPEMPRGRLIALMRGIPEGVHVQAPEVRYRQVAGFELEAGLAAGPTRPGVSQPGRAEQLNVDGELIDLGPEEGRFAVRVLPGALRLFAPGSM